MIETLVELWIKALESWISPVWQSIDFWRLAAIGLLTIFTLAAAFRNKVRDFLKPPGRSHDKLLFNAFMGELPSLGSISFIKDFHFGNSFPGDRLNQLDAFHYGWNNAEHEFVDKDLEKKRSELYEATRHFLLEVAEMTAPNHAGLQSVYPKGLDPELLDPQRAKQIHDEIVRMNTAAERVYRLHQDLIRLGKKKLS